MRGHVSSLRAEPLTPPARPPAGPSILARRSRKKRERRPANVQCPDCFGPTRVCDSRSQDAGVRRRRVCHPCGLTFTTVEQTVVDEVKDANHRRAIDNLGRRYLALGELGRTAVRGLIAAIEEAEQRGARHEAAAVAVDAATGSTAVAIIVPALERQ